MEFEIKPDDWPLIKAAIGLGDWLRAHPDTTQEQKGAVLLVQDALRRLPDTTPSLDAEYGFSITVGAREPVGLYRGWQVALSPPGELEIFSLYTPHPYPDKNGDFGKFCEDMMDHELDFHLAAGKPNYGELYYAAEWIAEVEAAERLLLEGAYLKIEAAVRTLRGE